MSWADKGPLCQSLEDISASPLMFLPPHSTVAHYDSHSDRAIAGDQPFPYAGCIAPSPSPFLFAETPKRACHTSFPMQ